MKAQLPVIFVFLFLIGTKGITQNTKKIDLLLFSGQYAEAIPMLQQLVQKDSLNSSLYFRLGKAYQNLNQDKLAIANYQQAHRLQPNSAATLLNLSSCLYSSGNYPAAEKSLEQLQQIDSNHYQATLLLAKTHFVQNNYNKSLQAYTKLSERDSLNPYLHKQIGNLQHRMQNFTGALASYFKAYEINPEDLSVVVHIIQQLYEMTAYQQALGYANKGLDTFPNNTILLKKKAQVLIGMEWYENALTILKELDQKKLLRTADYKQLGICYMQTKNYQKALEAFEACGSSFEKDPMINFYKGVCYVRIHENEKGIHFLENALFYIVPPIKASMHLYLAKAYNNNRDFEKSVVHYKKHLEMDDSNPEILYEIATTYEEFGNNKKKALQYYSNYIRTTENKEGQRYEYAKARILHIKEKIHFEK